MTRSLRLPLAVATLAAVTLALAQSPAEGRRYALLIGVKNYPRNELRSLKFTEDDVAGLADVLIKSGYRERDVVLMTQKRGADEARFLPTAQHIRDEIKLLLDARRPGDSVLIAVAGHGVQFKNESEIYFCPADARLGDRTTLVSLSEVYKQLDACKADLKVLLSDACRNDPLDPNTRAAVVDQLASATRPPVPPPPGGVVGLFSCSKDQLAFEDAKLKRGVFFHYVIEGLKGTADANGDGQVTVQELEGYLAAEVSDHVRAEFKAQQYPERVGTTRGRVSLVGGPAAAAKVVESPKPRPTPAPSSGDKTLTVDPGGGVSMEFVRIPKGDFLRGAPEGEADAQAPEKPQKRITISSDFYLAKYETTQEQYRALTGESPSWFSATGGGKDKVAGMDTARFPVEQVSHADALAFCAKLKAKTGRNATLPSEAQWEYACRARTTTPFHFGTTLNGDRANCDGNYPYDRAAKGPYLGRTCKVGQYPANAFGLCDMHGNVWEWCLDWYDWEYYKTSATVDPTCMTGERVFRVLRGGSCDDAARYCRAAYRNTNDAALRYNGFRVAIRQD